MLEVRGITIHNSGSDKSARYYKEYLEKNGLNYLCHFLVDETETIQLRDLSKEAYHTGKGRDWGNKYTIAIEICRSQCDTQLYMQAQERAIELIKSLMKEYSLTTNDVYFHNDFNINVYCPHRILSIYKNKKKFLELLEGE